MFSVKLLLAIVMSIVFMSIKTIPRSSKSCDCVTIGVLMYILSIFLLYTPHYHMILSKQKCCLLSTGVSTESQKRTSVAEELEAQGPCIGHRSSISNLAEFLFTQETKGVTIAHLSTMSTHLANPKAWLFMWNKATVMFLSVLRQYVGRFLTPHDTKQSFLWKNNW